MKTSWLLMMVAMAACCQNLFAHPMAAPPSVTPPPVIGGVPTLPAPFDPMGEEGPLAAAPPKDCYRITLEDGSMVMGEIDGTAEISLKAKVGDVKITMREVAHIEEAFTEQGQVTVTFGNGDRLTGKITIGEVKLKTAWGELTISDDGLHRLEAGKLIEESNPVMRRSLDGHSFVTIIKKHFRFQPMVEITSGHATPATFTYPAGSNVPWSPPNADAAPVLRPQPSTPLAPRVSLPNAR